jgi:hypothetical protein
MTRILIAAILLALPLLAHGQTQGESKSNLAGPEQQKPAEQPQAPIPGPTPQETSREARPAERADTPKTEAQSPETSSDRQTGSSSEPSKPTK